MKKQKKNLFFALVISLASLSAVSLSAATDETYATFKVGGEEFIKSDDYITLEKELSQITDPTSEEAITKRIALSRHRSAIISIQREIKNKNKNKNKEMTDKDLKDLKIELEKKIKEAKSQEENAKNGQKSGKRTLKILAGLGAAALAAGAGYAAYKNRAAITGAVNKFRGKTPPAAAKTDMQAQALNKKPGAASSSPMTDRGAAKNEKLQAENNRMKAKNTKNPQGKSQDDSVIIKNKNPLDVTRKAPTSKPTSKDDTTLLSNRTNKDLLGEKTESKSVASTDREKFKQSMGAKKPPENKQKSPDTDTVKGQPQGATTKTKESIQDIPQKAPNATQSSDNATVQPTINRQPTINMTSNENPPSV